MSTVSLPSGSPVRQPVRAVYLVHGDERDLEQQLRRALHDGGLLAPEEPGSRPADRVLHVGELSEDVLEPVVRRVGAAEVLVVVHVVRLDRDTAAGGQGPSASSDALKRLQDATVSVPSWFQGLLGVRSWVVIDVGRNWDDHEREFVADLLALPTQMRPAGVAVVCGSTTHTAAASEDEVLGMLVDAAWLVGEAGLGLSLQAEKASGAWTLATVSLTFDPVAWTGSVAAEALAEALEAGPLGPSDVRGTQVEQGERWASAPDVAEIDLLARPRAVPWNRVSLDRGAVEGLVPEDWAAGALQQYHQRAATGLPAAQRVVRGNARQTLHGTDDATGLLARIDAEVRARLRGPGGLRAAGAYVTGVSDGLAEVADRVRSAQRPHGPGPLEVSTAAESLRTSLARLPEPPAWVGRTAAAGTAAALAGTAIGAIGGLSSVPGLWGAGAGAVVVALATMAGLRARRRAEQRRIALVDTAEAALHTAVRRSAHVEQLELFRQLQNAVGVLVDGHGETTDDVARAVSRTTAVDGSAADRVVRLWAELVRLRDSLREDASLASLAPDVRGSKGRFHRAYPTTAAEVRELRSVSAGTNRERLVAEAERVLAALEWDDTAESVFERAMAAMDPEVGASTRTLPRLAQEAPQVQSAAAAVLDIENSPVLATSGALAGGTRLTSVLAGPDGLSAAEPWRSSLAVRPGQHVLTAPGQHRFATARVAALDLQAAPDPVATDGSDGLLDEDDLPVPEPATTRPPEEGL